jgi:hypothetical protein
MKRMTTTALAISVIVALASAGCATYAWQKPGAPAMLAEQDKSDCTRVARDMANDFEFWAWANRPFPGRYPSWYGGGWYGDYWGPSAFELEQRATDRCMESKGYRLVKQPKHSESASPRE